MAKKPSLQSLLLAAASLTAACVAAALLFGVYTSFPESAVAGGLARRDLLLRLAVAAAISAAAGLIISSIALNAWIGNPMSRLVAAAKLLAEGRTGAARTMDQNILVREIDELWRTVHEMAANQTMLMRYVRDTSERVSSSTGALRAVIEEAGKGITQSSHAISQLSDNIRSVSQTTQEASNSSQQTVTNAQEGSALVNDMVTVMKEAQFSVTESAGYIGAMSKRSMEIQKILDAITKISTQTHVLSLNAGIEAVRAGEAGAGFSVVAEEIRRLAQHSGDSSRQIEELVQKMQEDTKLAIDRSVKGSRKVTEGYRMTQEAQKRFAVIASEISQMTSQTKWMAAHVEAVATSLRQAAATDANHTKSIDQVTASTKELAKVVDDLKAVIEQFAR
ncbi:MAG: methyl-accepting chemotaxis protein [Elusimicrobia bacterium]|nr:methyl-accepting chemotaxis protein [Elusimicrobiota bacterium]